MPVIDITDAKKRISGSCGTTREILNIQHTPQASCLVQTKEGVVFGDTIYADNERVRSPDQGHSIIYGIGSLSKIVISCALCILVLESKGSEHEILLDDPITKHINQLSFPDSVTIQSLLLHRSGLPSFNDLLLGPDGKVWTTYEKFLEAIQKLQNDKQINWPEDEPKTEYSNAGFILAASLIEKYSNKSIGQFLKDKLFVPLGMDNTIVAPITPKDAIATPHVVSGNGAYWPIPHKDYSEGTVVFPAMGIYSCTGDLAKFFTALLSAFIGTPETDSPITEDIAKMVLEERARSVDDDGVWNGLSYGFGTCITSLHTKAIGGNSLNCVISPERVNKYKMGDESDYTPQRIFYHGGAITGYECAFYLMPEKEKNNFSFIIVLTNATGLGDASDLISRLMLQKLFALQNESDILELSRGCAEDRLKRIQLLCIQDPPGIPPTFPHIAGTYTHRVFGQSIKIEKRDGSLFATLYPVDVALDPENTPVELAVLLSDCATSTISLCTRSDEDFVKLGIDIYVSWGLELAFETENNKVTSLKRKSDGGAVVYKRL